MQKSHMLFLALAFVVSSIAVFAQGQKAKSNDEKHTITLQTDSGRYGVGSDKFNSKQLGVAIYPGAKVDEKENDGRGANLSLDWGRDSTRLYVQKYVTSDSSEQVLTFYRKQLAKFGAVVECRDGKPIAVVASPLKCEDGRDEKGIELKAGTANDQHIIGVTPTGKGTEFEVVHLEETKRGKL